MHARPREKHEQVVYYRSRARDAFVNHLVKSRQGKTPVERSSVITHLIPSVLIAAYTLVRPHIIPVDTLAAVLAVAATGMTAVTFAISVAFHMYRYVRDWGNWMRTVDTSAIYATMALNGVADLSLVSRDFKQARWQTIADPIIAATVLLLYFTLRRTIIPWEETREVNAPLMPTRRVMHVDMEHVPLRAATSAMLSLCWTPGIVLAFTVLSPNVAVLWVVGASVSTAVLWFGNLIDSIDPISQRCYCVLGKVCVVDSHAWWHVISTGAAVLHIAMREFVLYLRD